MSYLYRRLGAKSSSLVTQTNQRRLPLSSLAGGRLGLLLVGMTCLSACAASDAKSTKPEAGNKRPVPVVIASVTQKNIPIEVQGTGTAQAYSTVSVNSQIGGQLTNVYFREGQDVKKGDLLFTIDSRSLQAALKQTEANRGKDIAQLQQAQAKVAQAIAQVNQAKANVAKDEAQAKNNNVQAQRYRDLYSQGAVSQSQAEQFETSAATQQATVTADRNAVANAVAAVGAANADVANIQAALSADAAAIDNAKIQLSYSSIYAPIEGRTGSLKVNQGNLVKANDTNPLVVISQIHPIYVNFSISQKQLPLPELKKYMAGGRKLEVEVQPIKGDGQFTDEGRPERGELTFVDSSGADSPIPGTFQLKATFANPQERLTPGQILNVVLKLAEEPNAITVPKQALQTGQKGQHVFVVKPDKTVEVRPVTVGNTVGSETVIKQGLKPGEQVVTDGQFNLVPGARVEVKQQGSKDGKGDAPTSTPKQGRNQQ
ncbi:MAG TPA: efflux RND transporter periplasmic adaptor subunit [Coleofasciculaceae cyanobacterium]|jgi:multidrug efflux system membrane fusion protein